ncbi:MAG: site-specific integrase [Ruminococcaceae bacterium]|nr:site-specific integrase [Oscillospiraceae bacterium]
MILPQTTIEYDTIVLSQPNTSTILETIKTTNRLPFGEGTIIYSDPVWDFSPYRKVNVLASKFKIKFHRVPDCYTEVAKAYAFLLLARGVIKIQTVSQYIGRLTEFLQYGYTLGYIDVADIPLSAYESYFSTKDITPSYERTLRTNLHSFLTAYHTLINPSHCDSEILACLSIDNKAARHAYQESSKLPDIPNAFFNRLLDITLRIIKSNDPEDVRFHHIANMLLLLMQTGLRIGELCALKVDCLQTMTFMNKKLSFINYTTWKRHRGTNVSSNVVMYANELSAFAVTNLQNEFEDIRNRIDTDYLFVDPYNDKSYPISGDEFAANDLKRYYCYIDKYMPTINLDSKLYPELRRTKLSSIFGSGKAHKDKNVIHPATEQYRVHVCSQLYEQGVSLEYIAKYMGHLSRYMKGYYVRCKEDTQEDPIFSRHILSEIVSGNIEPLGGKESLLQKINEFIEANNFNVSTDMDQIVDKLIKQVPIRQKAGGVCIKSSMLRDCSVDAETNEFYCAYNVCPNIYHFFYMADYTYQQAVNLRQSIELNIDHGFLRQAEKERNMLRTVVNQKLIPELDSLRKHIDLDGREAILCKYPNLSAIIDKAENIHEEVLEWITNEQ